MGPPKSSRGIPERFDHSASDTSDYAATSHQTGEPPQWMDLWDPSLKDASQSNGEPPAPSFASPDDVTPEETLPSGTLIVESDANAPDTGHSQKSGSYMNDRAQPGIERGSEAQRESARSEVRSSRSTMDKTVDEVKPVDFYRDQNPRTGEHISDDLNQFPMRDTEPRSIMKEVQELDSTRSRKARATSAAPRFSAMRVAFETTAEHVTRQDPWDAMSSGPIKGNRVPERTRDRQRVAWEESQAAFESGDFDAGNLGGGERTANPHLNSAKWNRRVYPQRVLNHFKHLDRRQWLIYALVTGLGATVAYALKDHQHGNTVEVMLATPGGSLLQQSVTGEVVSDKNVALALPVSGLIAHVHVGQGDNVARDQILVSFDTQEAQLAVEIASGKLNGLVLRERVAQQALDELSRGARRGQVVRQAVDSMASELNELRAQIAIAESETALLRKRLEQLAIKAPFEGRVKTVNALAGTWSQPNQPLIELMDPVAMSVVFHVDSADAAVLDIGQLVALRTPGNERAVWEQPISRMRKNADGSSAVTIALNSAAPPLEIGSTVTGTFLGTHSDAFMLPIQALRRNEKGTWVAIEEDERVRMVAVSVGKQSARYVEVLKGLETGQHIILTKQMLEAGQHVHPVTVWAGSN